MVRSLSRAPTRLPRDPEAAVRSGVLVAQLRDPQPQQLADFLHDHLGRGRLVQVFSACEVAYQGRAASTAEAGDYLVMLKADGSLQVHSARGIKPLNWQPQVDDVRVTLEEGFVVLWAERMSPSEMVRVAFLAPAVAQALELGDKDGFVLMGTEAQMQRALARDPSVIEAGLELLDRELPVDVGGIDLYAVDGEGRFVVVELKRGKAGHEAVHQLSRYVERVRELVGAPVRGILAAPDATAPALAQLERLALEFRQVTALPLLEDEERQPGLFESNG